MGTHTSPPGPKGHPHAPFRSLRVITQFYSNFFIIHNKIHKIYYFFKKKEKILSVLGVLFVTQSSSLMFCTIKCKIGPFEIKIWLINFNKSLGQAIPRYCEIFPLHYFKPK